MLEAFRAAALAGDVTMEQAKQILASHKPPSAGLWQMRNDPKSGRNFFYNAQTRTSSWVLPPGAQLTPEKPESRMSFYEQRSQSLGTMVEYDLACGICDADVSGLTHCAKCGALVLIPEKKEPPTPTQQSMTEPRKPNLRLSLEDGRPSLHRVTSDPNCLEDDSKSPRLAAVTSPPAKAAPTRSGYTPKSKASPLSERARLAPRWKSQDGFEANDTMSPRLLEPQTPTSKGAPPNKPAPKREKSVILQSPAVEMGDSPTHDERKPDHDSSRRPSELEKKFRETDPAAKFRELTARSKEAKRRSAHTIPSSDLPSFTDLPTSMPPPPPSSTSAASPSTSLSNNESVLLNSFEPPPPPEIEPPPPPEAETEPPNEVEEDMSERGPLKHSRRKLIRGLDDVEDMVVGNEASEESLNTQPNRSEKDLAAFIETLRPQYGDGQLAKEPELLKTFFVQLINIPESNRHLVFHEFFLSVFWHEPVLQELLKYGSWKQWLLILISEAQNSSDEILDYVLMTLIGVCAYFFRKYSEATNAVFKLDSQDPLPLGFGTGMRSMRDFLIDATTEIDKHSQGISLRVLAGTAIKIVSWDRRPGWVAPDFTAIEWQNLFSMLEAQEEYLFFPLPDRQFTLPDTPDFPGMTLIESTILMLEKIKVNQLDAVPETSSELIRLQKLYSTKGMQELEFFKSLRDFFTFYSQIDCMEIQKAGFTIRTKVPVNCSISEFCHLLQNRKRIEYQKVQKTVAIYLKNVREYYKKVFSGEIAFSPRVDSRSTKKMAPRKDDGSRTSSVSGVTEASTPRRSHARTDSSSVHRSDKHARQPSLRFSESRLSER